MRNLNDEWFSAKKLSECSGLPSSPQGINKKARAENWIKRKLSGKQGKAVEYHYSSLPIEVQKELGFEPVENIADPNYFNVKIERQTQEMSRQELEHALKTIEKALGISSSVSAPKAEPTYTDLELSWVERRLIKDFRKCTEENQERILDMVEFTLERQEKKAREEVEDIERGLEVA